MLAIAQELDLHSCLPELPGLDWSLIAKTHFVFVGTGAVNRPLARQLAWLGMKRCLLIDPKAYKPQSVVSQCEPNEVGLQKAEVVAQELAAFGIEATALVKDVDVVPPGYLNDNSLMIVAVDNRRADICANRLAARMRCPIVKVNVEPAYLTTSIRCYDLRQTPPPICLECQMTDRHYEQQLHPLSCDGGPEQSTGSPRPLCHLAANAGALTIAQIVGSPDHWAKRWWGKQWQQNLLGGQGSFSELHPNPHCRWNHAESWGILNRIPTDSEASLATLTQFAELGGATSLQVEFSARAALRLVCPTCQQHVNGVWGVTELDQPVMTCSCGGDAFALPFFTHKRLPQSQLADVWDQPLSRWGIPPGSVLRISDGKQSQSFCIAVGTESRLMSLAKNIR